MNNNSWYAGTATLHTSRKCRQIESKSPMTVEFPASMDDLLDEVHQLRAVMATYRQLAERVIRNLAA
jgi:hypothetical protein